MKLSVKRRGKNFWLHLGGRSTDLHVTKCHGVEQCVENLRVLHGRIAHIGVLNKTYCEAGRERKQLHALCCQDPHQSLVKSMVLNHDVDIFLAQSQA